LFGVLPLLKDNTPGYSCGIFDMEIAQECKILSRFVNPTILPAILGVPVLETVEHVIGYFLEDTIRYKSRLVFKQLLEEVTLFHIDKTSSF